MTHSLSADFLPRDFNSAAFTDNPFKAHSFVFATSAFPILRGPKDFLAEKPILFWLEGPVVDGFGLLYFAVRPGSDCVGRSETNADVGELVDVNHLLLSIREGDGVCVPAVTLVASEVDLLHQSLVQVG